MTRTPLGSALMRQWLIRPSLELEVIEQRHETVACFLRTENGESKRCLSPVTPDSISMFLTSFCCRRDSQRAQDGQECKESSCYFASRERQLEGMAHSLAGQSYLTHFIKPSTDRIPQSDALRCYPRFRCNPRSHSFPQSSHRRKGRSLTSLLREKDMS